MTATINASTTAGVVTTADTSGILQLQTNGTAALTIDASQRTAFVAGTAALPAITTAGDTNTGIFFPAADTIAFAEGGVEIARFDSSGNLGLGASPTSPLEIVRNTTSGGAGAYPNIRLDNINSAGYTGLYFQNNGNNKAFFEIKNDVGALTMGTSNTERARIDSSGNLLVGGTSATVTAKLGIYQTATDAGIFINPSNASYNGTVIYANTTRAASSAFDFIGCYGNNVGQFRVQGSGVIYAQNTSVQSISDQRLKENIRDSSDGLSVISGLRPVRYDWKEGHGNNQKNQLGFIAQEIETVFPEAVSEWQVDKNDETVYKTVGPGALIPVLVKAIQELKAIVDAQGAEIAALKGATA